MSIIQQLFDLTGRTALVTGSARGIGFVIARYLGLSGARVIINDIDASACDIALSDLAVEGIDGQVSVFDVSDQIAVNRAAKALRDADVNVDVLVSNAGVQRRAAFAEVGLNDWNMVLNTHLGGAYACCQAFIPAMVSNGFGRVVLMSSVAGQAALPNISAYVAAKGAIASLTRALAVEYGALGITCNALAPGFVATQFTDALQENSDFQSYLRSAVPVQRWGTPEDIAPAVVYLASNSASFVNGHVLTMDGGLLARM